MYEHKIKVIFLGNSSVGKTSIINTLKEEKFSNEIPPTIGCEFTTYTQRNIKLMIWDTAGFEIFKSFTPQFCKGAKVCIIIYDASLDVNSNPIDYLNDWFEITETNSKIYIIGNKFDIIEADIQNKIQNQINSEYVLKNHIINEKIYEYKNLGYISAKTNYRIKEVFDYIIEDINKNLPDKIIYQEEINLSKTESKINCCY